MNKVLVTGGKGQLGSAIRDLSTNYPWLSFTFIDIEELDLTDTHKVESYFQNKRFDYCINCAAYTAVDQAEDDHVNAMRINAEVPGLLARVCKENNTGLIHISTDYVFDGKNHKPYTETDSPGPISIYGMSKYKGEKAITEVGGSAIIIRTGWMYSVFGHNFLKTMLRLFALRDEVSVVADQLGTPTYATDLARAILDIITSNDKNLLSGIYHYSNEGAISWFDFAKAIQQNSGLKCTIKPIETKDFPVKAKRPFYSVLDKRKIKEDFNVEVPYWLDSVKDAIEKLNKN